MPDVPSTATTGLTPEDKSDIAILLGELPTLKRELAQFDTQIKQSELETASQQRKAIDTKQAVAALEQSGAFTREQYQGVLMDAHQADLRLVTAQLHDGYLKRRRDTLQHLADVVTFALHVVDVVDPTLIAETQPAPIPEADPLIERTETVEVEAPSKAEFDAAAIVQAQEAERAMLARKLHNGPVQLLTNLLLHAEIAERMVSVDTGKAIEEMADLRKAIQSSLRDVRDFMASTTPASLPEIGLGASLRRYLDAWNAHSELKATLETEGDEHRLPSIMELALFRIVQEAVAVPEGRDPDQPALVRLLTKAAEFTISVETPLLLGYDSKAQALPEAYATIQRRAVIAGCGSLVELKGRTRILRIQVPLAA